MAGAIFINYRRSLNVKDAQLLQRSLESHFGKKGVFLDVSGLEGGDHWLHALERQVDVSAAMVALIGSDWIDAKDEKGQRRLENPYDFVRFEISRAFLRGIPVLPVLIDGARMPDVTELPSHLAQLTFSQAMLLRSESVKDDADKIARRLRDLIMTAKPRRAVPVWLAGLSVAATLAGGIVIGPSVLKWVDLPILGVDPSLIDAMRQMKIQVDTELKRRSAAELEAQKLREELRTLDGKRLKQLQDANAALEAALRDKFEAQRRVAEVVKERDDLAQVASAKEEEQRSAARQARIQAAEDKAAVRRKPEEKASVGQAAPAPRPPSSSGNATAVGGL